MSYPHVRRTHRLLGGGDFEERTYVDDVLVDIRRYHIVGRRISHRARLRLIRGSRLA